MLEKNPYAVVTPYGAGRTPLPRPSDLDRLARRTENLYCTAEGAGKAPVRAPVVEKTMRRELASRRVLQGKHGHVAVRWKLEGPTDARCLCVFPGRYYV